MLTCDRPNQYDHRSMPCSQKVWLHLTAYGMITGAYKVLYLASTGNPLITYFLIGRGIYVGNDTSQISLCLMFIVINNSSLLTSSDSRLIMSFANHINNDYFYIDNKYFWLDKTMQLFYLNFILYILQVLTQSLSQLWTV